jgi:pyruvate/2-oxoacid:ferredoxin oxidoreductase beta subunit/Pyruvate/2-oxoacid:ferredoxin oxidoreductase delta subunit
LFGLSVQAYPDLIQERVGLPAGYSFTFASSPIRCRSNLQEVDLMMGLGGLEGLKAGGILCLDSALDRDMLSTEVLATIARRQLLVWIAGADRLGTLLRLAPFLHRSGMTEEQMFEALERVAGRDAAAAARQGFAQTQAAEIQEVRVDTRLRPNLRAGLPLETVPEALTPTDFCEHVVEAYECGRESQLEADSYSARSLVPASTALERSFRNLAPDLPRFLPQSCTGCMDCVNICPDTAMWAAVVEPGELEVRLRVIHRVDLREELRHNFASTQKYEGALFGLFVDVDKCKGCGECVTACGSNKALEMVPKAALALDFYDRGMDLCEHLPETPAHFLNQKSPGDVMLSSRAHLFTGGSASCAGCGESTALRLLLAAGGFVYGPDQIGIVAARGCSACSTYPYNPFGVPWTSSLFENAAADALGIRLRWDQQGQEQRRLWVVGGDDALADAGLQSLSRLLASGLDVKVLVLDSHAGEAGHPDLSQIAMLHPGVLVAQTTAAHLNHFYRAVMAANEYKGPALIVCFTSCIQEHEIPPDQAVAQARLAVESRAFPLLIYDPRKGDSLRERLSLQGNPSPKQDWYQRPRTKEPTRFIGYARTEGRFARHFDPAGQPDEHLKRVEQERLESWRRLQELAGLR